MKRVIEDRSDYPYRDGRRPDGTRQCRLKRKYLVARNSADTSGNPTRGK